MLNIAPTLCIDFYKTGHIDMYPEGTELVLANMTARFNKLSSIRNCPILEDATIFSGLQLFIKSFLMESFDRNFFDLPLDKVLKTYKRRMDTSLGKNAVRTDHIQALHELGYLPLIIKALPEGTLVPIGVPYFTIMNTHKDFYWLTNYLETIMSASIWKGITSATTAFAYKWLLTDAARSTGASLDFVKFQGHDFSMRGMSGIDDACMSGFGHLTSFVGTDTVPAIDIAEQYYNADAEKELVGCSVPASEHSTQCAGSKEEELETYRRLITKLYPSGIVSIVSDTWDFWRVLTEFTVSLKPEIMARKGKVVFRPDSGDPVDILCGDASAPVGSPAYKGAVECLWDIFGGITNDKEFKELDPHVGLIYGDAITYDRALKILYRLAKKGFASSNVVFGIGSYTYEYCTRDTHGIAVKSTYCVINGKQVPIFKDPVTDKDSLKKSAVGMLKVIRDSNGDLTLIQNCQVDMNFSDDLLEVVFENGMLKRDHTLAEIRERIDGYL